MFSFNSREYPATPGCYLMRNARGKVIYVGKAKRLRNRLASYFQNRDHDWKTKALVKAIADIEVVLVNNEVESLVLENNLIKHYRPRFNRMLMRDDTGYKYIVLTDEAIPRFVPFKKHWVNKDLGEANPDHRFGPYPNGSYRDSLLDYICDSFGLRTCNPAPRRVCLRYHLGTCSGICEHHISLDAYLESTRQALAFLKHPNYDVLRSMKCDMDRCAKALDFEKAQRIKNQYEALRATLSSQIVERDTGLDQDVVYFGGDTVLVMRILQGAVLHLSIHKLDSRVAVEDRPVTFLWQHYARTCPDEIITNHPLNDQALLDHLRSMKGRKVRVTCPQRGIKRHLLALAGRNLKYRVGQV
jgi:excinuclease ABC subunit C